MDWLWLTLRVGLALACVLGLIWVAGRKLAGGRAARSSDEPRVQVVARTALGRHAGVAVLAVGNRRILVGFGEQRVEMLTELNPVVLPLQLPGAPTRRRAGPPSAGPNRPAPRPTTDVATRPPAPITTRRTEPPARPVRVPELTAAEQAAVRGQWSLAGSVLSPRTWKDAVHALQDRTVRR